MVSEESIMKSFQLVKKDIDGIKDELAFALRRIAKIEASLNKKALKQVVKKLKKKSAKKAKKPKAKKKAKK